MILIDENDVDFVCIYITKYAIDFLIPPIPKSIPLHASIKSLLKACSRIFFNVSLNYLPSQLIRRDFLKENLVFMVFGNNILKNRVYSWFSYEKLKFVYYHIQLSQNWPKRLYHLLFCILFHFCLFCCRPSLINTNTKLTRIN